MYCWYDNFLCMYGVIQLLLVNKYLRMVFPRNVSSYYSGGEDVAEHCWYNRESDCWSQLRAVRYSLLKFKLSTYIQETAGDRYEGLHTESFKRLQHITELCE